MKRMAAFLLTLLLCLSLSACGSGAGTPRTSNTRTFTDSSGRSVELPEIISTVAPSGSYAQIMLYTLCPEKLAGLSTALSRTQKQYLSEKYWDLPVFGQFYGGSGTMNLEALIAAEPDIIIDMGETKSGIAQDMDGLQAQTGIPTIFIKSDISCMADAYDTLGELLGEQTRAGELSGYIRNVMTMAAENTAALTNAEKCRVLYAQGEYGLQVSAAGSIHAEVLDTVGAINAAQLDAGAMSAKNGTEVSIEQVLLWQPDVILLTADANYDEIFTDPVWADVTAVQNGCVYEVPSAPYNWLDKPPSVQRILGILWLGNLLYPERYSYDITEKAQEFYQLFYQYTLSEAQAQSLLKRAVQRVIS